jgi:tetratricopeptide (TPR) repeat protein
MKANAVKGLMALTLAAMLLAAALSSCASAPSTALARDWYEIGNGWYDQGKWSKAGEAYSRAIALDPSLAAASYNLARALAEAGDYPGALKAIDAVLASDPSNIKALSAKAYILYRQGDPKGALAAYEAVLKLDPFAPDAIYNSTLLREAAGDFAGAIAGIEPLARTKTDDAPIQALYARVLAEGGRPDDAIAAYLVARSLGTLGARDQEALGGLFEGRRDYSKAMDAYAAAVATDPKRSNAWFALARIRLTQAEDEKGGLEALAKALAAGFDDKDAALSLLEEPVLAGRDAVAKALREKGLVK